MTYPFEKNKLISLILLAAVSIGCREKASAQGVTPKPKKHALQIGSSTEQRLLPSCPTAENPKAIGTIQGEHLAEISGAIVSRSNQDVMWTHNDSGDAARVYALDFAGKHLATVELPVQARDFEDIAILPRSHEADFIYVADTGDNKAAREAGVLIHRFEEPSIQKAMDEFPRPLRLKRIETMRLNYADGPRDAEALLVDPWSEQIILLTKPRMDPAEIFLIEKFVDEAVPEFAGRLTQPGEKDFLHLVTGADITTDGRWIVVRTYDRIALYPRKVGQSIAAALSQKPCTIVPAWLPQAEAISFVPSARMSASAPPAGTLSFVTFGEGTAQPIHEYTLMLQPTNP